MCFDASYLKKSCRGYEEFLMIVGIGGVRSKLNRRSFRRDKQPVAHDPQGFERDINPSNSSRRVNMVTREVWYEPPGRGGE